MLSSVPIFTASSHIGRYAREEAILDNALHLWLKDVHVAALALAMGTIFSDPVEKWEIGGRLPQPILECSRCALGIFSKPHRSQRRFIVHECAMVVLE